MYREYRDRAAFYVVYILEAHASDLWQDAENLRDRVLVANPRSAAEREGVASACAVHLGLEIPALVDGMDNAVEAAYTAWPDRLYVIDREGRVAYKSGAGPFGFHPAGAEQALRRALGQSA
jgi:type I thyroxine 5'-deiodinase